MRYHSHKAKWSACTDCPLHESRRQVVLASGRLPCDVLIIGEAPGGSEDIIGKPFRGPAGRELDVELNAALGVKDWNRHPSISIAITNVVACRPPRVQKHFRDPTKDEAVACSPRLQEFITKLAKPSLIVFAGRVAEKYAPLSFSPEDCDTIAITHPSAVISSDTDGAFLQKRNIVRMRTAFEPFITLED